MVEDEVEQVYQQFWREIVEPNGQIDFEQVKRELFDYRILLQEVPKVYDEITGGRISKPNTRAEDVIAIYQDRCDDMLSEDRE